jgi:hypothetical protein
MIKKAVLVGVLSISTMAAAQNVGCKSAIGGSINLGSTNSSSVTYKYKMVKPGEKEIIIDLKSNPASTGYQIYLTGYNHHLLTPCSSRFIPPKMHTKDGGVIVGAPGVREFVFKIKKAMFNVPQETQIKFARLRSWQPNKKTDADIIVSVYSATKPVEYYPTALSQPKADLPTLYQAKARKN